MLGNKYTENTTFFSYCIIYYYYFYLKLNNIELLLLKIFLIKI